MTDYVVASDRLIAAYNAKDFKTIRSVVAPDLEMAHFNRNFAVTRADDLLPVLEAFASTYMPDRHFEKPERITACGNFVIREGYWGGKPAVDIPGFGKAGERVRLKLCSVMKFDSDGVLVEWKDYG
jgi:hypothetical protein